MASVIKVERFDVDVTATSSQTHSLSNAVDLDHAFVRRITSIDKQSGPVGNNGTVGPDQASGAAFLSGTSEVSFRQSTTTSQKIVGEVWRYTGTSGGSDEFTVRGRYAITLNSGSTTASQAVNGLSNADRCIPFWTGSSHDSASENDFDSASVSVFIDASDNIQIERGGSAGTMIVYVTVVEFNGSNWNVGHAIANNHDNSNETATLRTSSTGVGGNVFNVGSWENAMIIEASLESDTSETGLSDNLGVWIPQDVTTATFIHIQDSNSRHDGNVYCHILGHSALTVYRAEDENISEGNNSYGTAPWPTGAANSGLLDEVSLEWFSDTSGTGTAHARGRLSAEITSIGNIRHWVHRGGNTVRANWGVAELVNINGTALINITSVGGDNTVGVAENNVVIVTNGANGNTQGSGKVELVENANYSGLIINQSIDSWSDTNVQFDVSSGALANTNCFLFITANSGGVGSLPITVGLPPETYTEAILAMGIGPDHYWTFQDTYNDEIGGATANASNSNGTSFSTDVILCKGDSHSLLIDNETDHIAPNNQSTMNTSALQRRYVGGWLQLDRISQTLSVIWEEGAQVNNMALLNGFGNNIMYQIADAAEDYVQLYMNISLTPNRPYHFLARLSTANFDGGICAAYLDGVIQSRTDGNPWEQPELDSHSGNISWGHSNNESLKVGDDRGVDATTIEFVSPVNCNYAHWYSWSQNTLNNASDIRVTLFEKGAPNIATINSGTQAQMQTAMDALADTVYPDWPCALEIQPCNDGDFTLTMDNITFNNRVSMQIRYAGADTITLVTSNGTVLDTNKLGAPYGGTFVLVDAVPIVVTVTDIITNSPIENARVLLLAAAGGPESVGDVLLTGVTNSSGILTGNYIYSSSQPVSGKVRRASTGTLYKTASVASTITNNGLDISVSMIPD